MWAKKISGWLIQQGFALWETRNQKLHREQKSRHTIHEILNEKIIYLYSLQDEVNHHDRHIFDTELEKRLKMSEQQKRIWIETTSPTIHQCIKDHQQNITKGQQDIRKYFTQITH